MLKVSILVPVYGVEKYIERCATSLFEQTYENIEYIFVDDCTKDESINILYRVLNKYPGRKCQVKIIRHKQNQGLGATRNTAVECSSGDFLMHVDSDDYLDTTCIEKCVLKQVRTNADIVSVDILRFGGRKNIIHRLPKFNSPRELNVAIIRHSIPNNIWGRLIRTSLYKANDIKVEKGINMSEDLNVLPKLISNAQIIDQVNDVLYYYECGNQSSYTSSFTSSKCNQFRKTDIALRSYFKNDKELINCILYRSTIAKINYLFQCALDSSHKELFYILKSEIVVSINRDVYKDLNFIEKMSIKLSYYPVFCLISRTVSVIKKLFIWMRL